MLISEFLTPTEGKYELYDTGMPNKFLTITLMEQHEDDTYTRKAQVTVECTVHLIQCNKETTTTCTKGMIILVATTIEVISNRKTKTPHTRNY